MARSEREFLEGVEGDENHPLDRLLEIPNDDYHDGVIFCDCPCYLPIEQGGAKPGTCIHCQVIG